MLSIFKEKILYLRTRDRCRLKIIVEGLPPSKKKGRRNGKKRDQDESERLPRPSFKIFYDNDSNKRSDSEIRDIVATLIPAYDRFRFAHVIDELVGFNYSGI
jgi:hypothetical protein